MQLEIVNKTDRVILENLLQLYLHDISKHFAIDFDSEIGKYIYDSLDKYFDSSTNYAYFIRINKDIVGFILVDQKENEIILQEIFILNNYKNNGIGEKAANEVFNLFRGKWIIKSLPKSEPAEKFWEKTVNNYTNNNFNIEYVGKYNRAVFSFKNN